MAASVSALSVIAIWPGERFTSPTHLTESGRGAYTTALAAALELPAAPAD